jgi:hypothetical protein
MFSQHLAIPNSPYSFEKAALAATILMKPQILLNIAFKQAVLRNSSFYAAFCLSKQRRSPELM